MPEHLLRACSSVRNVDEDEALCVRKSLTGWLGRCCRSRSAPISSWHLVAVCLRSVTIADTYESLERNSQAVDSAPRPSTLAGFDAHRGFKAQACCADSPRR